jgi:hypothetical protein
MIACTGNYPFVFAIENKIENPLPESAGNLLPAGPNDEY